MLIDKLGQEEVGRTKWRKMTLEQKYQTAYEAVCNKHTLGESIEATNFHSFLDAMNGCLGGNKNQAELIRKQMQVTLQSLTFDTVIAHECKKVYDTDETLGTLQPPEAYIKYFFDAFNRCYHSNCKTFRLQMENDKLVDIFKQLAAYHTFVGLVGGSKYEEKKGIELMEYLVALQTWWILAEASTADRLDVFLSQQIFDWDAGGKYWKLSLPFCNSCSKGAEYSPPFCNSCSEGAEYSNPCHSEFCVGEQWERVQDFEKCYSHHRSNHSSDLTPARKNKVRGQWI